MNNIRDCLSKKEKEKLTMMDKDGKALYFLCDCGSVILNDKHRIKSHEKTNKHIIYENNFKNYRTQEIKEYKKNNPNATLNELLDFIDQLY
jgi:ribosomal protein L30E